MRASNNSGTPRQAGGDAPACRAQCARQLRHCIADRSPDRRRQGRLLDAMNIAINLLRMEKAPKPVMSVLRRRLAAHQPPNGDDFSANLNS